jgi:tetratricopeptide (TPR) repeat protein
MTSMGDTLLAVRFGADNQEFTAGFGIKFRDFGLDYAFGMHTVLETSSRVSLQLRFGKTLEEISLENLETGQLQRKQKGSKKESGSEEKQKKKDLNKEELQKQKAGWFYQQAISACGSGMYQDAVVGLTQAEQLDSEYTNNTEFVSMKKKVEFISSLLHETTGAHKVPELVRKGIRYYLADKYKESVDALQYAYSLNPQDKQLEKLVTTISAKTGIKLLILNKGMNWMDQKLFDSLNYFYAGQYDLTVSECIDMIAIEPNNALVYKRLGSAYYQLGMKDKAAQSWKKLLELNPNNPDNKDIQKLLKELEK